MRLVYVSDTARGLRRKRKGRGFVYVDARGRRVTDKKTLQRIRSLAIPPAYVEVWICANPKGHLQATGRDARGRKQYRYHPEWRRVRDADKFTNLVGFGQRLPALRRRLRCDLKLEGFPREKVLAIIVSLLMETRIRIGNAEYARENLSYGLTTLRDRHVEFLKQGRAVFRFRGKGGKSREVVLDNRRLVRLVRNVQDLPGQQLFQYVDERGTRHPVRSQDVNDYLREAMNEDFTAKDFRTWIATSRAVGLLARTALPGKGGERAVKSLLADVVGDVAAALGNTPAVCRKSYICPAVFEGWRKGSLHRVVPQSSAGSPAKLERRTLAFLRRQLGSCD